MIKQWVFVLLFSLPLLASAQAPDNEKIEVAIHNSSSPFYYPPLMDRYYQGDPKLTLEDYRHLYYGYIYQPEYNPYASVPEADSIVMILMREPDLMPEDYRKLIRYGNTVLEYDPFSPRILNLLTYAYGVAGDEENEKKSAMRFDHVIDAILSTGEGNKESSPWHIIHFTHAQDVLDQFGLQYKRPIVISRTVELFQLFKREGRTRGYYFDFSRIYTRRPDEQPSTPKERRWQINDQVMD